MADRHRLIVVAGAGNIGGYVGGWLAKAGREVVLLARPPIVRDLGEQGLLVSDLDGGEARLAAGAIKATSDATILAQAGVILVTVKSGATRAMAASIAAQARPDAIIVSLQNGVGNAAVLREALPHWRVLAGMVPFNVARLGSNHLHKGTSGSITVEKDESALALWLSTPDLAFIEEPDIVALQWGKLLINLNNALNALSGLPLREQLLSRPWRRLFAAQITEALAVLDAASIPVKPPLPIPLRLFPLLLSLPTALFRRISAKSLRMDAEARSSMWDDLEQSRPTEIEELQGEIIALARRFDLKVPVIARITALIREAEQAKAGSPRLDPQTIRG